MKRFIRKYIFISLILLLVNNLYAKEKIKVFFIDFNTIDLPEHYGKIIKTYIENSLIKNDDFSIIERDKVDIIIKEINVKEQNCQDAACIIKTGELLTADLGITGTAQKKGKGILVKFKIIIVDNARIISTIKVYLKNINDIDSFTKKAQYKITKDIKKYEKTGESIKSNYEVYARGYLYFTKPILAFNNIAKNGFAFNVNFGIKHLLFENSMLGLSIGYNTFFSKGDKFDIASHFPILISLGYKLRLFWRISLVFYVMPGINIAYYKYDKYFIFFGFSSIEKETSVNPFATSEFYIDIKLSEFVSLQPGCSYNVIFEKKNPLMYLGFTLSFMANF